MKSHPLLAQDCHTEQSNLAGKISSLECEHHEHAREDISSEDISEDVGDVDSPLGCKDMSDLQLKEYDCDTDDDDDCDYHLSLEGGSSNGLKTIEREYTAKEVQVILKSMTDDEKIGLALLNYYARTDLVPATGSSKQRGRPKYSYADVVLLCWLFRMKREGLPVNRFRRGIAYLRRRLPRLYSNPKDMIMLTDGNNLFIKHRIEDKDDIAEVLTGPGMGQYVWAYSIGSLIEEIDRVIHDQFQRTAA